MMNLDKKESLDIDWFIQDSTNVRIEGTVFNPVVEQMNLQEGVANSLPEEGNPEK